MKKEHFTQRVDQRPVGHTGGYDRIILVGDGKKVKKYINQKLTSIMPYGIKLFLYCNNRTST